MGKAKRPNSNVIWEGPSRIDGKPIVVILSGLTKNSANGKTGAMLQTWILLRDVSPYQATVDGSDRSICGGCIFRGIANGIKAIGRACYVNVAQAPLSVWKSYRRGNVPTSDGTLVASLKGRRVRIGSYGDPAAVPVKVWQTIQDACNGTTGYTHQWRTARLQRRVMASVDSMAERLQAVAKGYRTFRVIAPGESPHADEILCPASAEMGHRTSCEHCGLCDGSEVGDTRKSIAIVAHGNGAGSFVKLQSLRG